MCASGGIDPWATKAANELRGPIVALLGPVHLVCSDVEWAPTSVLGCGLERVVSQVGPGWPSRNLSAGGRRFSACGADF